MAVPRNETLSILIVDDSAMVRKFAQSVLGGLEVRLSTADNGREALEQMEKAPADILVTDLMMPEMDGFELISRLRSQERFQSTHIIVMTTLDQIEDKVRALGLGANDYTVKPLHASEFRARVEAGLRERRLKNELTAALAALDHELQLVARLQQRLLPQGLPQGDLLKSAVFYQPCSRAGGDYYDLFTDARGRRIFTIADVSGHGASAAVLMGMFRALLKVFAPEGETAAEIIHRLNRALVDNIGSYPDFVSVFLGLIDRRRRRLNFCSAGHGDMMLIGPEKGRVRRLAAGGTVLGFFEGTWQEEFVDLMAGQSLVLYTDGLIEAADEKGEEFGRDRLEKLLRQDETGRDPAELVDLIRAEMEAFTRGTASADDITLFVIRFD